MPADQGSAPRTFYCALTHQLMTDPVIDTEGNTYERSAIEEWIARAGTSPITRSPLTLGDIVPNRALCDAIAEYRAATGDDEIVQSIPAPEPCEPVVDDVEIEKASVSVKTVRLSDKTDEAYALVTMTPPAVPRVPVDICCVVDVSGSMDSEISVKDSAGNTERHGLSILDIVKHAVRTIIGIMSPNDRVAVFAYHTTASKMIGLTPMNDAGKAAALRAVDNLTPQGTTNLWDGLYQAMEELKNSQRGGRQGSIMLLTDGMPNVEPPRGHIPTLKRYLDQAKPSLDVIINTFGFGYSLNSELLSDIARETGGTYSFVPDGSFVGTAFVNATCNALTSTTGRANLLIEPLNGVVLAEDVPGYVDGDVIRTSWGIQVGVDTLQTGQERTMLFKLKDCGSIQDGAKCISAIVKYKTRKGTNESVIGECAGMTTSNVLPKPMEQARCRLAVVDCIRKATMHGLTGALDEASKEVSSTVEQLTKSLNVEKDKFIFDANKDVDGQVKEAVSKKEWFDKWGVHYLPSLMHSHQSQRCLNFKDPGPQHYGGDLFNDLRDEADDIFMKIAPPTPSKPPSRSGGSRAALNMRSYNCSSNPCFHGQSRVLMADGVTTKRCDEIKKGDLVVDSDGKLCTVKCVVKTLCFGGMQELVELPGGLLITPWHPVLWEGKWMFPCEVREAGMRDCDAVYSFVLDNYASSMVIEGVVCVTLAHGITGDIREHEYYGTSRVVDDLEKMAGWGAGMIILLSGCAVRDPVTTLVVRLQSMEEMLSSLHTEDAAIVMGAHTKSVIVA